MKPKKSTVEVDPLNKVLITEYADGTFCASIEGMGGFIGSCFANISPAKFDSREDLLSSLRVYQLRETAVKTEAVNILDL